MNTPVRHTPLLSGGSGESTARRAGAARLWIVLGACCAITGTTAAQDTPRWTSPPPARTQGPLIEETLPRVRDYSWIYVEPPPPPAQIKVHDIITIEVDEKAEVIVNSRFNRQRNGSYKAQLKEFVKIVGGPKLITAADNQPTVEGNLQNRLQTIGQLTDSEGITYRIAATVVDVLPNGTIVLEARKSIRTNQDFFEYRLTGRVDKGKIKPDRTARTEDIAELKIERVQRGKVFDSTKVNWGTRILDVIVPF
jgi:flagellar L-ring protein precursor FlgH